MRAISLMLAADRTGLLTHFGRANRMFDLGLFRAACLPFDFTGLREEGRRRASVSFSSPDGSTAGALTIDFLNATGQGTFTRADAD